MRSVSVLSGQNMVAVQFLVELSIHYSLYCAASRAHLASRWNRQLKMRRSGARCVFPGEDLATRKHSDEKIRENSGKVRTRRATRVAFGQRAPVFLARKG